MSSKFFTNRESNSLFDKFVAVFENVNVDEFDALVGYFRSSGYFKLRDHLDKVNKIRILVGINADELIAKHNNSYTLFDRSNADATREEFLKNLLDDIQECNYKKEIEDGISKFMEDIESEKIELRAHPSKKLHAKIYIFKPIVFNEHTSGEVITGSSNLTEAGLGINNWSGNYEFNVMLRDYADVKFAADEFDKLWIESHPILASDIQKVKEKTFIKEGFTVKQLYYKLLIEYFGKNVDFDPNAVTDLPKGFIKLNYQLDAVDQGLRLLEKHNGFLLSDVVGLGKTIIAILIAKKYFYSNGFPNHLSRTLIVVPPALEEVWKETIEKFALMNTEIITNGSLHKVLKKANKYDLVIVDEAHKFRNSNTEVYDNLIKICKEHAGRQNEEDDSYYQKKIILMSATPLNNKPDDIKNLVFLFQDGKNSTLDIPNLTSFFNVKKLKWEEAKRLPLQTAKPIIEEIYSDIREKIIQPLTIRRTRTDLLAHPIYKDDLEKQGIVFPKVGNPKPLYYELDAELDLLYEETLKLLTPKSKELSFNRYKIISFLKPELKKDYKDAERTSEQLVYIMRILLVKRIDSSFVAFKSSLKRFVDAMEVLLQMRDNNKIVIAPKLKNKVIDMMLDGDDDALFELLVERSVTDPTIKICQSDDFIDGFFEGVERDLDILRDLLGKWQKVNTDPKYDKFKGYLSHMMDKKRNPEGKVIVFSESKDTTTYIVKRLKEDNIKGVIDVDASNRKIRIKDLKENFDANYKEGQKNEFNIVITTEVLAEGVNLHRSNTIVNYDTPWNATRLMQRIGRVNRIGSTAAEVFVYNFFPTTKVENDIELKKKAILKLVAFHNALGEDSQIYSPDEGDIESFGLFDQAPTEERDLNLNFLMELRKYREDYQEEFLKIKNLPLKVRVALEDEKLKATSYCFLKNERKNLFYEVSNDETKELSFTKMAESLKSSIDCDTTQIPESHYTHVDTSLKAFQKEVVKETTQILTADDKKGPQEKASSELIAGYSKAAFVNDEQRELMKLALKCIQLHSLPNMTNELFKLSRNLKKSGLLPLIAFEAIMKIIEKYPVRNNATKDKKQSLKTKEVTPRVILSLTYC
jgi:superfamily II DNA or RNA helicase